MWQPQSGLNTICVLTFLHVCAYACTQEAQNIQKDIPRAGGSTDSLYTFPNTKWDIVSIFRRAVQASRLLLNLPRLLGQRISSQTSTDKHQLGLPQNYWWSRFQVQSSLLNQNHWNAVTTYAICHICNY